MRHLLRPSAGRCIHPAPLQGALHSTGPVSRSAGVLQLQLQMSLWCEDQQLMHCRHLDLQGCS